MKNLYKIQDELYIIDNNEKVTQNGIWAKCSFTGDILKNRNGQYAHKVILTTNNLLIKDGVQAIDDEFLEWFVKNPSCEEVETHIVKLCTNCGQQHCDNRDCRGYEDEPQYLISYPENTTQRIITYCDGYEVNTEKIIIPKEEPKQETTIEKVAFMLMPDRNGFTNRDRFNFIEGANYREIMVNALKVKLERSYSEEEVMDMFHNLSMHLPLHYEFLVKEQFKKK